MIPTEKCLLLGVIGFVEEGHFGKILVPIGRLKDEFNALLLECDWLNAAPFRTISYTFRFESQADPIVRFGRTSRNRILRVSSTLCMGALQHICLDVDAMYAMLLPELVRVLRAVGEKYDLPPLPNVSAHAQP